MAPGDRLYRRQHLEHALAFATADVEDTMPPRVGGHLKECFHGISDIQIVTHHAPITPNLDRFSAQNLIEAHRDDVLPRSRPLSFAVGIRQTEHWILDSTEHVIEVEIFLDGELADAIGTDGVGGVSLVDGDLLGDT